MNLLRRIERLERMHSGWSAALTFPDGSTRAVRGPKRYPLELLRQLSAGETSPDLEAIFKAVSVEESGAMVELLWALRPSQGGGPGLDASE